MCNTCGCNITPGNRHLVKAGARLARTQDGKRTISVLSDLLQENNQTAAHNRAHFDRHRVLAINLMSAPGAGKTALLEATIEHLRHELRIAVIEGDLETENDAQRIRARGVPAIQITTGSACHLDAHMVHDALHALDLSSIDIVFIENVGNLVCPAGFDLGHHRNVILLSVTEGDDKPAKYPVMFRAADLVLLSKCDLLEVLDDFDPARADHALRQLASEAPLLHLSARKQIGLSAWFDWLHREIAQHRERVANNQTLTPNIQREGIALPGSGPGV